MPPLITSLLPLALFAPCIIAQASISLSVPISSISLASAPSEGVTEVVGASSSFPSGIPLTTSTSGRQNATATSSTTTEDLTALVGATPTVTANDGSATTSARPQPTNTRPCNGYTEFCNRKFSNVSMVVAHNSPFVRRNNAASNQLYPVLSQLEDGIRGCEFSALRK